MRAATWPQSPRSLWVLTRLFNKYGGVGRVPFRAPPWDFTDLTLQTMEEQIREMLFVSGQFSNFPIDVFQRAF